MKLLSVKLLDLKGIEVTYYQVFENFEKRALLFWHFSKSLA